MKNAAKFDHCVDRYDRDHRAGIKLSGEEPASFAEYKIRALDRRFKRGTAQGYYRGLSALGVVGAYAGKIYREVKQCFRFIVANLSQPDESPKAAPTGPCKESTAI